MPIAQYHIQYALIGVVHHPCTATNRNSLCKHLLVSSCLNHISPHFTSISTFDAVHRISQFYAPFSTITHPHTYMHANETHLILFAKIERNKSLCNKYTAHSCQSKSTTFNFIIGRFHLLFFNFYPNYIWAFVEISAITICAKTNRLTKSTEIFLWNNTRHGVHQKHFNQMIDALAKSLTICARFSLLMSVF